MNCRKYIFAHLTVVFFCLFAWMAPGVSQENSEPLDEVKDMGNQVFVIKSREQFVAHANALSKDLDQPFIGIVAEQVFQFETEDEFDKSRPIVFYAWDGWGPTVFQLPIQSMDLFEDRIGDEQLDLSTPFPIIPDDLGYISSFIFPQASVGVVQENRFIFGDEKSELQEYLKGTPLADSLNDRFRDLINESGISLFAKVTENYHPDLGLSVDAEAFTEQELETLQLVDQVIESAQHTALGFTYDHQSVALNGLIAFTDKAAAEKVFDYSVTDDDFQPTIGLPTDRLVSTVSLQVNAFQSPNTARLLPKLLSQGNWGGAESEWFHGQSIQLAMELLADAWHDVDGVRMGLYEADGEAQGNFCIVGSVDGRDPDTLMTDLQKLVWLVDKNDDQQSQQRRTREIDELIDQLGSDDYKLRLRATTRLTLAGTAASKQLEVAKQSNDVEIRSRATSILDSIEEQLESASQDFLVGGTGFWANLRPQFSMDDQTKSFGSHPCRVVKIHPDPSKNSQEVRDATDVMIRIFGESWDTVPICRVGDRFVFMFGSNQELFVEAIDNMKESRDPIGSSEVIQKQDIQKGQIQMQVSLARIINVYYGSSLESEFEVTENNLTTLNVALDPETWGVNLYMPVEELKALIDYNFRGF